MNRQHGLRVLILSSSPLHRKTITRFDGLTAAGATVVVAGYERDNFKDTTAVRYDHVSLGTAKNRDVIGRLLTLPLMLQRALAAVRRLGGCDIFWTNSLDMLALGTLLRPLVNNKARIVYDVADLTPRQLSRDFPSRLLRLGERLLCTGIKTLLITSPWFYWRYYRDIVPTRTQVMLLENKVSPPAPTIAPSQAAPPWRIVWHGLLRCRDSLETIVAVARQLPDLVDIHAWGSADLDGQTFDAANALPNFSYHGAYSDASIDGIFESAHFLYAFDLDDGLNSRLLLPNRLYHGAARALPLLAVRGAAVGRTVDELALGMSFDPPFAENLIDFIQSLTPETYEELRARIQVERRNHAVYSDDFERILGEIASGSAAHCLPREENASVVLAH